MKTAKDDEYKNVELLLQLGEIDLEEYNELMANIGPPKFDLDDFEPLEHDQPEQEPNTEPLEYDQPEQEPEEPLNDFKPEEIGPYRKEYLGKNWQNTKYYY